MTHRYTLFLVALFALSSCEKYCKYDPSCKTDLKKGLLAYYPFNQDFNDQSGKGNHAESINGASLGTDMVGHQASAASFDGVDDYLIVNNSTSLNSEVITVSCEVLVNSTDRRHALINRLDFASSEGFQWGVGQALDTDLKYSFAVAPNTEDCSVKPIYDPSNAVFSDVIIEAGRWYNVISTFDKGTQKIYIDGKLVGSVSRPFNALKSCSAADLVLGGWWSNDIISLDGKMDEVRIYNRALSDCEISELSSKFAEPAIK